MLGLGLVTFRCSDCRSIKQVRVVKLVESIFSLVVIFGLVVDGIHVFDHLVGG